MDLKEKTVSSLRWNTVATIVTMLLGVLQVAILTRLLDKSAFGLIAIASMVISFTDIFAELGLATALIHKMNISQNEYSSVYWLNIGMSLVICLLTILSAPLVALFYKQSELTLIVRLLSLKIVFTAFGKMFHTIKIKNLEFAFISKVRILTSVVGILVSTILAWRGFGVISLVWGQLVQIAINQGIFAVAGMRQMRLRFHFSFSEVKDVLKIGGYHIGTQVLDFAAARLDVFLIGKFFSMEELGVYNIAKELITKPLLMINNISSSVFSSVFAKIQDNIQSLRASYDKLVKIVSMMAAPVYAAMFVFADLVVKILYAPSFADVAVYIRILSLWGLFSVITSQGGAIMIAKGRTDLGLKWTIVRIIMTTMVLFATARISLIFVAWGQTFMALAFVSLYFIIVVKPLLPVLTLRHYVSIFSGVVLGVIMIATPFSLLNRVFELNFIIQLLMGVSFVSICYLYYELTQREAVHEMKRLIFNK